MKTMVKKRVGWLSFLLLVIMFQVSYAQFFVHHYYDPESKQILKEKIEVKDTLENIPHGEYTDFFINGVKKTKGYFKNGVPEGRWVYFFEKGSKKMEGEMKDGKKDGVWTYFLENGNISLKQEFQKGLQEGKSTFYFENGQVKSTGKVLEEKKEGIWNYYYESGELLGQAVFESNSGPYQEFYPSGKNRTEGKLSGNKKEGLWIFYYENGEKKSEGYFKNDLRDGTWTFYFPNGKPRAKGAYKRGYSIGLWQHYYPSGNLRAEGVEKEGYKDGYWKLFTEEGENKGEVVYEDSLGYYTEKHPNGNIKVEGRLINEQKDGPWRYYYDDGTLEGSAVFEEDNGYYKGFYKDGSAKMEGQIVDGKRAGIWRLFKKDGSLAGYYKPIYEDDEPVFRVVDNLNDEQLVELRAEYEKPEYRFKNKKIKYFVPRINEFKGLIVATNPLMSILGRYPIALEYYYQERLGYELELNYLRNPFFESHSNLRTNVPFHQGLSIAVRQKFYHTDQNSGMLYFGHNLQWAGLQHGNRNALLSQNSSIELHRAREHRIEYGLIAGNRFLQDPGNGGITLDFYLGVGIGYRIFDHNFSSRQEFSNVFNSIRQGPIYIPVFFGLNLGFLGPKRKVQNF